MKRRWGATALLLVFLPALACGGSSPTGIGGGASSDDAGADAGTATDATVPPEGSAGDAGPGTLDGSEDVSSPPDGGEDALAFEDSPALEDAADGTASEDAQPEDAGDAALIEEPDACGASPPACDAGVLLSSGLAPACTCASTIPCTSNADCTVANGAGPSEIYCDLVSTDPAYGTCQACTSTAGCLPPDVCDEVVGDPLFSTCVGCSSGDTTPCGASHVCDLVTADPRFDTCVQCSAANATLCTPGGLVCDTTTGSADVNTCVTCAANNASNCKGTTPVCDTTPASPTFDKCVACTPANGAANAGCQATNSAFPICDVYSGVTACGQCTTATAATACPSEGCAADGHCQCIAGDSCPSGTTCSSTSSAIGECN